MCVGVVGARARVRVCAVFWVLLLVRVCVRVRVRVCVVLGVVGIDVVGGVELCGVV